MKKVSLEEVTTPSYPNSNAVNAAWAKFRKDYTISEQRHRVALGVGPEGIFDSNFNREYRRHYFLTHSDLLEDIIDLLENGDRQLEVEQTTLMWQIIHDIQWWVKHRPEAIIQDKGV